MSMPAELPSPPAASRARIIAAGRRYWRGGGEHIEALAPALPEVLPEGPYRGLAAIALPDWARDIGVGAPAELLVDARAVRAGQEPAHLRCDWLLAAELFLTGAAEREHEARSGPAHSYAWRLRLDPRAFDHAWVNRIFLLLRRWAARERGAGETALFGPLPSAEITLTHDLDAISKRPEIRFKQGAFHLWNSGRHLARRELRRAGGRAAAAARFVFGADDLWTIDELVAAVTRHGLRSRIHVYAGPAGLRRGWPGLVMDPGYDCADPGLATLLRRLAAGGFEIGLHPGFGTWRSARLIREQRDRLARALSPAVTSCRQHWLRFSWAETWAAQAAAGLTLDTTLGFNDRPGFRNSAALAFAPSAADGSELPITAVPLILMDSHIYDYDLDTGRDPGTAIERWIGEVRAVGGEASVLWHPHTLHRSYGWRPGFEALLEILACH